MKRIILMVLRLFYILPGVFLKFHRMAKPGAATEEEKLAMLAGYMEKVNRAGRVTVLSQGQENVPKEENFLYTPNHQGLYDVLAFMCTSPRPYSVVMKKEVENIILIKQYKKLIGGIGLDRSDIRQGLRVIKQVGEEIKGGKNFLIFPEGTREKEHNKTLEFKGGTFKAAQIAKCPIVPVAMIDSYKPFDEGHTRPVTMEVHYLPAIPYEEYKDMKTGEIAEMVRGRIDEEIARTLASRGGADA